MKFLINKIHPESAWYESKIKGAEVIVDEGFINENKYSYREGYCDGYFISNYNGNKNYACGFTIAEIDDEGYQI